MPTESTFLLAGLFLLLAAAGWTMGRFGERDEQEASPPLNIDYLKGLNFLLNEQTDQALDLFLKVVRVDTEKNLLLVRGSVSGAVGSTVAVAYEDGGLQFLDFEGERVTDKADIGVSLVATYLDWQQQLSKFLLDIQLHIEKSASPGFI